MAQVFGPGGAVDVTGALQTRLDSIGYAWTNSQLKTDPTQFDAAISTGALVSPLNNLIVLEIDPIWWAKHRNLWRSPLGRRLPITFLDNEDGLTENVSVAYADTEIVGRAESYKTYMGAANRELPITFQFRAQGISSLDVRGTIQKEVIDPYRWLDALNFPIESGGISYAPPTLFLTLGELITMRCVATNISSRFSAEVDPQTYLPIGIDVSVTFVSVAEQLGNYNFEGPLRLNTTLEGVDGPETAFGTTGNQT